MERSRIRPDGRSRGHHVVVPSVARQVRRADSDVFSLNRERRVLDAGCGTGGLLLRLTHDLPQFDYTGLDYDAAAVKIDRGQDGCDGPVAAPSTRSRSPPITSKPSSALMCCATLRSTRPAAMSRVPPVSQAGQEPPAQPSRLQLDEVEPRSPRSQRTSLHRSKRAKACRIAPASASQEIGYWNSLLFPLPDARTGSTARSTRNDERRPSLPRMAGPRCSMPRTFVERRSARRGFRLPFGASVWAWAVKP